MNFISNGDYNFPFDVHYYWMKMVYIWSYQTGAANPDGIIRMPGRLIDLLVFAMMGNLAISVFYLLSAFLIVFVSFYCFSKYFLKISNILVSATASLFFTINPIFLGNASKIGIVLAAAMLPLCLVAVQKVFEKQQLRYFLLWIAFLNLSLIHPFTFAINLLVSGGYLLFMAYRHKPFVMKNILKIIAMGIIALLLNAYFLLPLAGIGTISKDVLSASVSSTPTDYTALVDVANTGDIFTGLSLAKEVFKDYEFYNDMLQPVYFFGIFSFYVILFGIYVRVEKKLSLIKKQYFAWSLAAFLLLLLLAAVNYLHIKDLIKLLIELPGGWIFRSPLKWQLYVPFTIATMLAIVLVYVPKKSHKIIAYSGLAISFLAMNSFISLDIAHKLLTPRQVENFSGLQQTDLSQKSLLLVNDERCFSFASEHPRAMTELNQILASKNVQVKQVSLSVAGTVNLGSYDYVLGCQDTVGQTIKGYDFTLQDQFIDNAFQLYHNTQPRPYIYANQNVFALDTPKQVGNKYELVTKTLQGEFDFINTATGKAPATTDLQNAYEDLSFKNLDGSSITTSLASTIQAGKQTLYFKNTTDLYMKLADHQLRLSPTPQEGYQVIHPDDTGAAIDIPHEDKLTVVYTDSRYDSTNIFPNPSLEQGNWQKEVGDCYSYGEGGKVKMSTTKNDKTNGTQALQLEAQDHIACTGPENIPVSEGQNYLMSFDYKSIKGRFAGYNVSFDDEAQTSSFKRLDDTLGKWDTVTESIAVPAGAHNIRILLYAYPDNSGINTGIARYDNFQLTAIPDIQNHIYLVNKPTETPRQPKKVSHEVLNPTKSIVHVEGVQSAFYLETKESYSPRWSLGLTHKTSTGWWPASSKTTVAQENHVKINNSMNGWLVDPAKLCQSSCKQNSDGSYDIDLVMEFTPQRWFYIGVIISGATLATIIGYFIYQRRRSNASHRYQPRRKR